ncbi:hypothetical protein KL918_003880 [Ogataea parapolymorpha]|uniref:Nitrogen regulatory protein GLN3 n=1 Tax=Ogataea parapolymorpha (strain ATCC 26012 / BCRC 20466 / JCM 22074 / NRRL Y-7560 / DL-1) TaxID=871575 RepID=W1QCR1_OGAPD|nr:Nitrogen regulatory protein GLN3 [Ogataea parapolymorpha DL-1]ESW98375.1 Nitrogen regulatory protein GLN3 [Ogataea parapolymorpha DL-1]KAG7865892.1 hypothetical protein KL918_003880 [Ogataea parapolymorpha]KAG7874955.1 hypothetical protein KL916_001200 [Ogataea parapolymorpha]
MESNSIWDIYMSAKNILPLYPRIENRNLREENMKIQQELCAKPGDKSQRQLNGTALTPCSNSHVSSSPIAMKNYQSYSCKQELTKNAVGEGFSSDSNMSCSNLITPPSDLQTSVQPATSSPATNSNFVTPISMSESPKGAQSKKTRELNDMLQLNLDDLLDLRNDRTLFCDHDPELFKKYPGTLSNNLNQFKSSPSVSSQNMTVFSQKSEGFGRNSLDSKSQSSSAEWDNSISLASNPKDIGVTRQAPDSRQSHSDRFSVTPPSKPLSKCFNCGTTKTPLWRRDSQGNTLCNACGLFQKLHGTMRPLSLKTDIIKKRNSKRQSFSQIQQGTIFNKQFGISPSTTTTQQKMAFQGSPQTLTNSEMLGALQASTLQASIHPSLIANQNVILSQNHADSSNYIQRSSMDSSYDNQNVPHLGSQPGHFYHSAGNKHAVPSVNNSRSRNVPILPKPSNRFPQSLSNPNTPLATTPIAPHSPTGYSPTNSGSLLYSVNHSQPQDIPRFKRLKSRSCLSAVSDASSPPSAPMLSNFSSRQGSIPNNLYHDIQAKRGIVSQESFTDDASVRLNSVVDGDINFGRSKYYKHASYDPSIVDSKDESCTFKDLDWLKFDV